MLYPDEDIVVNERTQLLPRTENATVERSSRSMQVKKDQP